MNELDRCRPFLEPALAYNGGTHDWSDIVDGVHSSKMQLWANKEAAAITEIVGYPRKTVLNVFIAGGDMAGLIEMLEDAKAWGAQQGCETLALSGRRGWVRVLDKHGWSEQFTTMMSGI